MTHKPEVTPLCLESRVLGKFTAWQSYERFIRSHAADLNIQEAKPCCFSNAAPKMTKGSASVQASHLWAK
jgi:hypothetical protein